jgi:hypothetical protein
MACGSYITCTTVWMVDQARAETEARRALERERIKAAIRVATDAGDYRKLGALAAQLEAVEDLRPPAEESEEDEGRE